MNPDRTAAVAADLRRVTAALTGHEDRPGQLRMAELVADAIGNHKHLIVQAGTGTGKTLAYLVPALTAGTTVVVATATKALQDQLASKDLPFVQQHLGVDFEFAVLKGRSNYVCMQRVHELGDRQHAQLELDGTAPATQADIRRLIEWSGTTRTGDMADLSFTPHEAAWRALSVGSDECPGAKNCSMGQVCFAELARNRAAAADVTVVNLHLYGLDVASGGMILPDHQLVVVDEVHQLEDVMSDTVGIELSGSRFLTLVATLRRVLADPDAVAPVAEVPAMLRDAFAPFLGQRVPLPLPVELADVLVGARGRLERVAAALKKISTDVADAQQRALRATQLTMRLQESIDLALKAHTGWVAFVEGKTDSPRLEIAPLDVGPALATGVWAKRTAVLTSATIPSSLPTRVGMTPGTFDEIDVGSPFDYEHHAMLYCALHLPDPRNPGYSPAMHEELAALITAAGGRTLALFTSWKAMDAAAAAVKDKVDVPVLTQRDFPKTALVNKFRDDESSCLFATAGFFQGVDIPGRTLSLVTVDRIPFPRPDDPLLSARRELLGPAAFSTIDVPRASMLLAQAVGRLIRTADDRGVVAVFDRRLGTAGYRWDIVKALPPMRRTRHRADAEAFLGEITR